MQTKGVADVRTNCARDPEKSDGVTALRFSRIRSVSGHSSLTSIPIIPTDGDGNSGIQRTEDECDLPTK